MDFFSFFYRFAVYGQQLFHHLSGWSDADQCYLASLEKFTLVWSITFATAVVCFIMYYYVINHPRSNRWFYWLIPLSICIMAGFGLAFGLVMADLNAGVIAESLAPYIGVGNAIIFGVYNGVLCGLFFFLLSLLFRMWSSNCKHSPWPLMITKLNNKGKQDHE